MVSEISSLNYTSMVHSVITIYSGLNSVSELLYVLFIDREKGTYMTGRELRDIIKPAGRDPV